MRTAKQNHSPRIRGISSALNLYKFGLPISLLRRSFTIAANGGLRRGPSDQQQKRQGGDFKYIPRKVNECPLKRDHTVDGSFEIRRENQLRER